MSSIPEFTELQQVIAHLKTLRSRGEIKRWGTWLETSIWFESFIVYLISAGYIDSSEPEVHSQKNKGKKYIRLLLDREQDAQIRKNPIHRDESFVCCVCHKPVEKGSIQIRDHCPFCLHGLHLDIIPGDRASDCLGVLKPHSIQSSNVQNWILYTCQKCNYEFRVRAHPEDDILSWLHMKKHLPK